MSNMSVEVGSGRLALAPRELAARLGVSKSFIYAEIAAGRLPHVRLGTGRILIELAQLEEYLRRRRWGAGDAAARSSRREAGR